MFFGIVVAEVAVEMRDRVSGIAGKPAVLLFSLWGAISLYHAGARAVRAEELPVPPTVARQVEFWKKVFTTSRDRVLLHDPEDPDRVYAVLDFGHLRRAGLDEGAIEREIRSGVERERERLAGVLRRLAHKHGTSQHLTPEEERLRDVFEGASRAEIREAAARVRSQRGIGERFARGLEVSRRYFPAIEEAFRRHGVPPELSRLALVESSFDLRARSSAGAAGVWQFLRSTGRLFLRIDEAVDERFDPLRAADAAARFLRRNYELLGTWPLAVTAYNHGPQGMARAVERLGTRDIERILREYRSPTFGFASRNFYAEVLAAIEVDAEPERYFGPLSPLAPLETEEVVVPDYVPFRSLARVLGVHPDELAEWNPALTSEVRRGKLHVPRGYLLRLPPGLDRDSFRIRYARLPANERFAAQKRLYFVHRVRRGDTLLGIARRYGTSVEAVRRANGLRGSTILVGQALRIPSGNRPLPVGARGSSSVARSRGSARGGHSVYRVRPGDTLHEIARRHGTSVDALRRANGIRGSRILAGEILRIPAKSSARARRRARYVLHRVEPGQTLFVIARRYGTTVRALQEANGLRDSRIYSGQRLKVPVGEPPSS
ncbi:MAG: hypothetical protein KatS3mg076_0620 [Candidatus Binatia bacterium]|nr:MAG: hypothetical protein KatS3mg076_0620 [Candidatus Binatia bacterium]